MQIFLGPFPGGYDLNLEVEPRNLFLTTSPGNSYNQVSLGSTVKVA
jgi:hypothetical protein